MGNNMRNKFIVSTGICIAAFFGIVFATYYTRDENGNSIELKNVEKITDERIADNTINTDRNKEDMMPYNNDISEAEMSEIEAVDGKISDGDSTSNNKEKSEDREVYIDEEETVTYRDKTEVNPIEGEGNLNGMSTEVNAAINNLTFNNKSRLLWPVEGNIILEYNMDNTVYFPTLNEYKTNPALVIQSEEFAPVKAAAKGVVTKIGDNDEIGVYIKTAIGNDYEITYSQIVNPTVEEGQVVEAGDVIACVNSPTRFYEKEGYNLNFALTRKGKPVDPMKFMTVSE
ncbi:MAG: M23 family metallopeptidase [Lachnospiraceae bacterium]|nr:M23 family metallopeptidase [Lachnospiraceae bacterium]